MTIYEMMEREDIYSIIEKTLKYYYKEAKDTNVNVSIQKKCFLREWNIYPRLGIIVNRFPTKEVRREVYSWFDVQNSIVKKIIAKCYIFLCFITFGLLADRSMEITDKEVCNRNTLFIPGNRRIRIYQLDNGYVDVVMKDGFDDTYFNNEVEIRNRYPYPFILKIEKSGNRWYRERFLRGRSLVRTEEKDYGKYLSEALNALDTLYEQTKTYRSISDYGHLMVDKCSLLIDQVKDAKGISSGEQLQTVLNYCKVNLEGKKDMIPIVFSHGDLQNGNIHIDERDKKVYLIDWETGGYKSIWYDAATLLCYTRRKDQFSHMINEKDCAEIKEKILYFDNDKNRNMKDVVSILLLEEMFFFLDEMMSYPSTIGKEVIDRFTYELNQIDWNTII